MIKCITLLFSVAFFVGFVQGQTSGTRQKKFQAFLAKLDAAQEEFHNGRPAALEELWSHADDVTLAGGTGGPIEKGWASVKNRLDAVTTHYSGGKQTNERVDVNVSGDFASVIQYEHIAYRVPGRSDELKKDYRISMIFRYERNTGWRLVHRQADTQTVLQVTK